MKRDAAVEAVFQPVRPPTTFEETVERLGTAIRVGLLLPGSKLPAERQLSEELRISRSTLRQALTTLVQSGHLTASRGRSDDTHLRNSASGWFYGRAWSKAASLPQAASTATILGKRSSGTLSRRAL